MKFFSANLENLRELYNSTLQRTVGMEQQIAAALPAIIDDATDKQLKEALQAHLYETQIHVNRIAQIVTCAYGRSKTARCKVTAALIASAEDLVSDASDASVRDAAVIAVAQQIAHHQIAVYRTLRTWADSLGSTGNADTFDQILNQEKHADHLLTGIATRVGQDAETRTSQAA
jgi:ferritin-like metal-binding protein YciE